MRLPCHSFLFSFFFLWKILTQLSKSGIWILAEQLFPKGGTMKHAAKKIMPNILVSFLFIMITVSAIQADVYAGDYTKGPIKIASIFAHTGKAAKSNKHSIEGVRIGIDEVNKRDGVLGKKLELIRHYTD
jgi:ABC-type branched-subunit amino acid transport system substrate-binding protein